MGCGLPADAGGACCSSRPWPACEWWWWPVMPELVVAVVVAWRACRQHRGIRAHIRGAHCCGRARSIRSSRGGELLATGAPACRGRLSNRELPGCCRVVAGSVTCAATMAPTWPITWWPSLMVAQITSRTWPRSTVVPARRVASGAIGPRLLTRRRAVGAGGGWGSTLARTLFGVVGGCVRVRGQVSRIWRERGFGDRGRSGWWSLQGFARSVRAAARRPRSAGFAGVRGALVGVWRCPR